MLDVKRRLQFGFTLTELMVALFFTGILMAGLASVYRSSLNVSRSEGEKLTSGRRNRVSLEILRDDLDSAGQTLENIIFHTSDVSSNFPLFAIYPDGRTTVSANEQRDMLQFFYEEALPFEGRLYDGSGGVPTQFLSSSEAIGGGDSLNKINATTLDQIELNFRTSDFRDAFVKAVNDYAGSTSPIALIFKDQWRVVETTAASAKGGTMALVTQSAKQDRESGSINLSSPFGRRDYTPWVGKSDYTGTDPGAPVVVVRPRLLARYAIEELALDPSDTTKTVPCLVKNLWPYDALSANPTATPTKRLIAEDVVGVKVSVSFDSGATWVTGTSADTNSDDNVRKAGWTAYKKRIDDAIKAFEDPKRAVSTADSSWFRYFPMLLRLDLTTRTPVAREKGADGKPTYAKSTRVLVAMPRYFGLPLTSTQ